MARLIRLSLSVLFAAAAIGLAVAEEDDKFAARVHAAEDIRPVSELLARVEAECRGRFVEIELDEDDGRWVYEIKLLGPHGDVAELDYDARDLRLLEAEGLRLAALGCVPAGTPD